MKKAVYWLMGERGGKATLAVWNWLWGISEEVSETERDADEDAIATAEASLKAMQKSVQQLADATNQQYTTYQQAKATYIHKAHQLERAEKSAATAQAEGRNDDATAAMYRVMQLETLLPQLEAQVEQAEEFVRASQTKLRQERTRLESYRNDLQALKNLTEVNEALTAIAETHNEEDMASARAQFEAAKTSVQTRYLEKRAYVELSVNSADQLDTELDATSQQQEVAKRLHNLKNQQK
ncbi:MAG: PspA/IM30 family protein [Leptolyngbya sp. SIO3F4]|nr:PspA/IM30 family protein [Leptolyngbya sp. SIO3F4]